MPSDVAKYDPEKLAVFFDLRRDADDLSQRAAAAFFAVHWSTVSAWELGLSAPIPRDGHSSSIRRYQK